LSARQVLLRAVAFAFFGALLLGIGRTAQEGEELGTGLLALLVGLGAGAVALVVTGALVAWRLGLARPVVIGVAGPLASLAISSALVVPLRLLDPGGDWEPTLPLVYEINGRGLAVAIAALAAGYALVAWAAAGRLARLAVTALGLVVLQLGAGALQPALDHRREVHHYANLGVPLLVPDLPGHPLTGARAELPVDLPLPEVPEGTPEAQTGGDAREVTAQGVRSPVSGSLLSPEVGVLVVNARALEVRIEPPPTAELSCANLFDPSARPGLDSTSELDVCEELAPDRWLVRSRATGAVDQLIALRPDALVAVDIPPSDAPDADLALLQDTVDSLVPTTPERLAALD